MPPVLEDHPNPDNSQSHEFKEKPSILKEIECLSPMSLISIDNDNKDKVVDVEALVTEETQGVFI